MTNPTSEAMEAGLRAVREMVADPAPANDAPDAAGDDARVFMAIRVETIAGILGKYGMGASTRHLVTHDILEADPATSRIRELEETNRALAELLQAIRDICGAANFSAPSQMIETVKGCLEMQKQDRSHDPLPHLRARQLICRLCIPRNGVNVMSDLLTIMAAAYHNHGLRDRLDVPFDMCCKETQDEVKCAMAAALRTGAGAMKLSGNEHQLMAGITIESFVEIAEQAS